MWIRTCQECGHIQEDKEPVYGVEPSDAYCNRKCKKCKSEALDYGKDNNSSVFWPIVVDKVEENS